MTALKHLQSERIAPRFDYLTEEDEAAEQETLQKMAASVLTYNRILDVFCGLSLSALVVCLGIFAYQAIEFSL